MDKLREIAEEIRRMMPELLGIIVISEEGLPLAYEFSKAWDFDDPIILGGLISSATSMMENVLGEFGDKSTKLVFTQGEEYSILVGRSGEVYVAFLTTSNAKLGTLFMEMKRYAPKIAGMFSQGGVT